MYVCVCVLRGACPSTRVSAQTPLRRLRWNRAAGTFSNGTANARCLECDAYSVAPDPGLASCILCGAGQLPNANHTVCSECAPGYEGMFCNACQSGFVKPVAGPEACEACPAGTASDAAHVACRGCPLNTFALAAASNCTVCALGFYAPQNATHCSPCQSRPPHSRWTVLMLPDRVSPGGAHSRRPPQLGATPVNPGVSLLSDTCMFECDVGYLFVGSPT